MKTMLKLTLMVALLGSTAMADGDMGNGNQCPPTAVPAHRLPAAAVYRQLRRSDAIGRNRVDDTIDDERILRKLCY